MDESLWKCVLLHPEDVEKFTKTRCRRRQINLRILKSELLSDMFLNILQVCMLDEGLDSDPDESFSLS